MPKTDGPGLERSCARRDRFRVDAVRPGFERGEASFNGPAFAPHRHDTYALGLTLDGVQCFRYRGVETRCLAGQAFVLHPDELHDGHAGTDDGFTYRMLYLEPALLQEALEAPRCPLPFLRGGVSADARLLAALRAALSDDGAPVEELRLDSHLVEIAEALSALDPSSVAKQADAPCARAVFRARVFLDAEFANPVTSAALERATGLSRFALARHFRAYLGTSPHRYVVMRRLDRARALMREGASLADAALASGFADQSHMTRHFTRAYGVTPARWRGLAA
ncbi:MAG: AraC family transcriptional regulator [Alphaproteobacteria bacterium]